MYFVCQVLYIFVCSRDFLQGFYVRFIVKCIYKSYIIQLFSTCLDLDVDLPACQ